MTAPERRWSHFSLRTLFVMLTAICCWLGWNVHQVQERERMIVRVRVRGGLVNVPAKPYVGSYDPPLVWRLLGTERVDGVYLCPADFNEREYDRVRRLFPEAQVGRFKLGSLQEEWHASFSEFSE